MDCKGANGEARSENVQPERDGKQQAANGFHPQNGRSKNGKNGYHARCSKRKCPNGLNGFHANGTSLKRALLDNTSSSAIIQGDPSRCHDQEELVEQELIPGLTDDLAVLCLSRLPRSTYGQYFTVSRKFYEKFRSGDLYKIRQELGIVEQWMYILSDGHQRSWRAFNPRDCTWRPLRAIPSDYTFEVSDKETLTAGTQLLVRGMEVHGYVVWIYDLVLDKWRKGPDMIHPRCLYASASCGNYGFVAGGTDMIGNVLSSAERYNPVLGCWEPLAELNKSRKLCSGFYMDGKFFVIGGNIGKDQLTCGEEYDPASGTWKLIPNMYFGSVEQSQTAPPLVAVVDNELYALETSSNQLKVYNKVSNDWKTLGEVPVRADVNNGWGIAFKALEGELFVIGGRSPPDHIAIWAWKPNPQGEPQWRYVTRIGTFIYNCAVMAA